MNNVGRTYLSCEFCSDRQEMRINSNVRADEARSWRAGVLAYDVGRAWASRDLDEAEPQLWADHGSAHLIQR